MSVDAFCKELASEIGEQALDTTTETLTRYSENTMAGGPRRPSCVIFPGSTQEVQGGGARRASRARAALPDQHRQ